MARHEALNRVARIQRAVDGLPKRQALRVLGFVTELVQDLADSDEPICFTRRDEDEDPL